MSPKQTGAGGNPYIESLVTALISRGVIIDDFNRRKLLERYDVVHIHWPEHLIRWNNMFQAALDVAKVLLLLNVARKRGARIVWTAHDLGPHEKIHPRLYRLYESLFLRNVDEVIALSNAAIETLRQRFPAVASKNFVVIPHGHYRNAYPSLKESRTDSRKSLGLNAQRKSLLILGQLRRYKGIDATLGTFAAMQLQDTDLLIVGETKDEQYTAMLRQQSLAISGAELRVGRATEFEVSRYLNAADVVLAIYNEGSSLNSGAALLALSFNRPVVVRDTPTMRELRERFGADWVHLATPGSEHTSINEALRAASKLAPNAMVDTSSIEWEQIARLTLDTYSPSLISATPLNKRADITS